MSHPAPVTTLADRLGLAARRAAFAVAGMALLIGAEAAGAAEPSPAEAAGRLVRAYPDFLAAVEGNALVWKDGTRMTIDDGGAPKPLDRLFAKPDLKDIFRWPYPAGAAASAPGTDVDPGRVRHQAMLEKMYGNCQSGGVGRNLVEIAWLPKKTRQRLKVSRVNGVAERLGAVSRELDELPAKFDAYLYPAAGTYNCRAIAGTDLASAHGFGIAIDIALKHSHYWRWTKPDAAGNRPWRNAIPAEIVAVFEKHGFIWGGRWSHYDTMHFEYRPELIDTCRGEKTC